MLLQFNSHTINQLRKCISATLLALYIFIATPVQFWHHHCFNTSSSTSKTKEAKKLSSSVSNNIDSNCAICSHHYSVYTELEMLVNEEPTFEFSLLISTPRYSYLTISPLRILDRGPPALV